MYTDQRSGACANALSWRMIRLFPSLDEFLGRDLADYIISPDDISNAHCPLPPRLTFDFQLSTPLTTECPNLSTTTQTRKQRIHRRRISTLVSHHHIPAGIYSLSPKASLSTLKDVVKRPCITLKKKRRVTAGAPQLFVRGNINHQLPPVGGCAVHTKGG